MMSVALDRDIGGAEVENSSFAAAARGGIATMSKSIFESPAAATAGEGEEECSSSSAPASSSATSSSIGKNSDASGRESSEGEENEEVQSAYKGSAATTLDCMDALEEALPMRRGISKFYNGKSKSFTSLVEASSSFSVKDIAKAENAYTRRRRNLLAFNHVWDKNRSFPHRGGGGGILKRPISSSRSTLALAVAMSSSESISSASEDSNSSSNSGSPPHLPPLHPRSRATHNSLASLPSLPQGFSPWRSFSLADLQQCATATATATAAPSRSSDISLSYDKI